MLFNKIVPFSRIPPLSGRVAYRLFTQEVAAQVVEVETEEEEKNRDPLGYALKPREVVDQLDKYIIGQGEAKRAVAIALRNRWRRHQLKEELKNEIIPKNILMIGPTGCGKTEIARRIAKLSQAPFIKVEATKFTEVGFHGKDVDQIIKDLVEISINMTKKKVKEEARRDVSLIVEEKILDSLLGYQTDPTERETMRNLLRKGAMKDKEIEIEVPNKLKDFSSSSISPLYSSDLNDLFKLNKSDKNFDRGERTASDSLSSISSLYGSTFGMHRRRVPISEALLIMQEVELERMLENYDVSKEAIRSVEQNGIVFIDEIDKLVTNHSGDLRGGGGADASSEGVQRDLLPLIEGSSINTKHGDVNTDFILFIASGAFQAVSPSDLLAELQGRLPIRVTLDQLKEEELYRILTEPVTNLIKQQIEMLKSERVNLVFKDEGIREIAKVSFLLNKNVENIGARRLHTVIEKVMEDISFNASDYAGQTFVIDEKYVKEKVGGLIKNIDLSKYIL